ncbi:RNA-binding S4 domain-containing protein [soil metagenome]
MPGPHGPHDPRDIAIREQTIRLGQLLKLAGLADSGSDARALVQDGAVTVNGEIDTRRGRQLRRGDIVAVGGESVRVA